MTLKISAYQIRMLRMKAQRLLPIRDGGSESPARVLRQVIAVQAQDLHAALLSIRARSAGLTTTGIESALQVDRTIVWTWCMRGTLHLVTAEDALWLVPFLGPAFIAAHRRRFMQLGWDEQRARSGLRLLEGALTERGALSRPEVVQLLQHNDLPFEGQAPVHLLYRAALEGILCMGASQDKKSTYVLFETWLGIPQPLPRQVALVNIAHRYLGAYGPARPVDLAGWSGLKLSEAREAWGLVEDQLVQVDAAGESSWMLKTHLPWLDEQLEEQLEEFVATPPVVRLLPRFDTYLLGYSGRELVVDPAYARRIHPGGGLIYPVLLVDGRALGTWRTARRKAHLEILVTPFISLTDDLIPQIEAEVSDLARFLGEEAVLIIESPP